MNWTPDRWAKVWASRLDGSADDPHTRSKFRSFFESNKSQLRGIIPDDLLDFIEETAASENSAALQRLIPLLTNFAKSMDDS